MKVCVFGAGAVGGNLAARLAHGGANVCVVARGAQRDAIRENGLSVTWQGETLHERVRTGEPEELGAQDFVVVTLKAPSIASAAPGIARLLGPSTRVVFATNGLPWWYRMQDGTGLAMLDREGIIARHIPRERVVGGVVYVACSLTAPGHITLLGGSNALFLGLPDRGEADDLQPLADALTRGGVSAKIVGDIREVIWRKLALNLASSPLAVLGGASLPRLYGEPALARAACDLLRETAAIAAAEGCSAVVDQERFLRDARLLPHKPSALQDAEAGRPMEVAALLDAPCAVARAHGVETPVLDLVAGLVRVRQG